MPPAQASWEQAPDCMAYSEANTRKRGAMYGHSCLVTWKRSRQGIDRAFSSGLRVPERTPQA